MACVGDGLYLDANGLLQTAIGDGLEYFGVGVPNGGRAIRLKVDPASPVPLSVGANGLSLASIPGTFGRNLLRNGDKAVFSRGRGPYVSGYGVDGTSSFGSGTTDTWTLQGPFIGQTYEPIRNFERHMLVAGGGTGDYYIHGHPFEWADFAAGKTLTYSAWFRSNVANAKVGLEWVQQFGSGGSGDTSTVPGAGPIVMGTSWTRLSRTFTVPSTLGRALGSADKSYLFVWLDAGSGLNARASSIGHQSVTIDITGEQLEEGTSATPFEVLPKALAELACYRFLRPVSPEEWFGQIYAWDGSTASAVLRYQPPVPMRIAPAVTLGTSGPYVNGIAEIGVANRTVSALTTLFSMPHSVELGATFNSAATHPMPVRGNSLGWPYILLGAEV